MYIIAYFVLLFKCQAVDKLLDLLYNLWYNIVMNDRKETFIIVRVTKPIKKKMVDLAKEAGVNLSTFIRKLLEQKCD